MFIYRPVFQCITNPPTKCEKKQSLTKVTLTYSTPLPAKQFRVYYYGESDQGNYRSPILSESSPEVYFHVPTNGKYTIVLRVISSTDPSCTVSISNAGISGFKDIVQDATYTSYTQTAQTEHIISTPCI